MFERYRQKKLEKYAERYLKTHPDIKLVAVTGSSEKSTTKTMVAQLLSQKYRVQMDDAGDPSRLQVALDILGIKKPDGNGLAAWHGVYAAARERMKQASSIDVIVQELDAHRPGDLAYFAHYLCPSIAVITATGSQNGQGFGGSVDEVAKEELALANSSEFALINHDTIEGRFAEFVTNPNFATYGVQPAAEYRIEAENVSASGYDGRIAGPEMNVEKIQKFSFVGDSNRRAAAAACAVGLKLGMSETEIATGVSALRPIAGQMNTLRGANESWIIDNTYEPNIVSTMADLKTLQAIESPHRIALFGDFQAKDTTTEQYEQLGDLCNIESLAWVVTVGEQTEKYLAPKAKSHGCQVKSFHDPLEAGAFIHSVVQKDAVVLAAGGSNCFLEEALKIFLHESHEDHELVRQSEEWIITKDEFLSRFE